MRYVVLMVHGGARRGGLLKEWKVKMEGGSCKGFKLMHLITRARTGMALEQNEPNCILFQPFHANNYDLGLFVLSVFHISRMYLSI